MADPHNPYREPEDVGARSPASRDAKEQNVSGARGGPREARQRGRDKQPAQSSGRRSARHEQEPTERKRFEPDENPAAQGNGKPSPDQIRTRMDQQGIEPRSGSHSAHDERAEERAQQGPPDHGHTRHGRQKIPGQPERPIPPESDEEEYT